MSFTSRSWCGCEGQLKKQANRISRDMRRSHVVSRSIEDKLKWMPFEKKLNWRSLENMPYKPNTWRPQSIDDSLTLRHPEDLPLIKAKWKSFEDRPASLSIHKYS